MKGAAMSLTAAVSGFVALLIVSVVQGLNGWSVTYTSTQICALKGSTVDIRCSYSYPSTVHNITTTVQDRFWFVKNNEKPVHLKAHSHRFEYRFHENDCTLRIRGLRERDSAEYKFRFKTNQDGGSFTGSPGVALNVTDLQVKVRRSSTQTELQCHTSCRVTDPPSYVWYNNGEKLKEQSSSLRVSVRDDDSSYSCAVKGHEDHRAAPVFSPKLYYMLVSPSAETVEGRSITLNCGFTANPAANYTWYKGNSQRYLSEGTVLGLESIQPSDSGEYYCTAENELGRTSESIFINVKYAPKLPSVSVSPSAEIVEGSSVTLTCSSDANPAANYTWYKENKRKPLSVDTQLVFSSIQPSDSGEYHCRAYNQVGETSESISIHVKYPPKLVSVSASPSNEIKEGGSVTLTCNSDANPAAEHFWYKDGDPNPLSNEWKLSFSSIQSSDSGEYFCVAENNLGRRTSESIFIVVIYGPKFLSVSVSPSGEIQEGSSVTLTCSSDANPAANYTWYKEDGQVPLIVDPQLVFTSIQPSDSGEYYCTALNKVMTSTTESVSVDVMYAPKLPSVSVSPSAEIVEGSSVTLTCSSDANPAANYTWYKEDDQTPLSKESQLIFSSIQPSDSGEYYCTAENKLGMPTPKYISIDVTYAPKLPSVSVSPSAEIVEGSSVTLTCSSDANPAANYTWYKKNEDSAKASGQNFTITDFRPEHSGSYYCEAQNTRGRQNSTLQLTVVSTAWKLAAVSVPAILLALILSYSVILWIIKKRSSKQKQPEPEERTDASEQVHPEEDSATCASVYFCNHRVDPICSIRTAAQTKRHKKKGAEEEGMVEHAAHT